MTAAVQSQKLLSFRQIDHFWTDKFIQIIEIFAVFLVILEQTPDSELSRSTQQHLLQIIAHNWIFWARVTKETDDNLEWISDTRQTTALGLDLPPNRGAIWLTVLADFEALVKGRLLLRHRQLGDWASAKLGYTCRIPVPLIRLGFSRVCDHALCTKGNRFLSDCLKRFNWTFRRNPSSLRLYLQWFLRPCLAEECFWHSHVS